MSILLTPSNDGRTHINVYSKGRTALGRWLSNFAYSPFEHPSDGPFHSVEGYWYWLSCKGHPERDDLRKLSGFAAKKRGRELHGVDWPDDPEFRNRIKTAIMLKMATRPDMVAKLKATNLPLTHYYVLPRSQIYEVNGSEWILDILNSFRASTV